MPEAIHDQQEYSFQYYQSLKAEQEIKQQQAKLISSDSSSIKPQHFIDAN